MEEQTIALQTLDEGQFVAEIMAEGTVRLRSTLTEEEIVLTPRAAYQLLDLLHDERTRLYRCANGLAPAPELPAWIKLD